MHVMPPNGTMTSAIPLNVKNLEHQQQTTTTKKTGSRHHHGGQRPDGATWGDFTFAKHLSEVTPRYDLESDEKDGDMFTLFAWSNSCRISENNLTRERSKFEEDQRMNRERAGTRTNDVVAMVSKTRESAPKTKDDEDSGCRGGNSLGDGEGGRQSGKSNHQRQQRRSSMGESCCSVRDLGLEPDALPPDPHHDTPRRRTQRRSSMPLLPTYHRDLQEEQRRLSPTRQRQRSPALLREPERQRSGRAKRRGSTSKRSISHDGERHETEMAPPDLSRHRRRHPNRQRSERASRSKSRDRDTDHGYQTAEPGSAPSERHRSGRARRRSTMDNNSTVSLDGNDERAAPSTSRRRRSRCRHRSERKRSNSSDDADAACRRRDDDADDDASEERARRCCSGDETIGSGDDSRCPVVRRRSPGHSMSRRASM